MRSESQVTTIESNDCVRFLVNGVEITITDPQETTLAQVLRDHLGLRGTKVACDQGACGACTVIVDAAAVFACHTFVGQLAGAEIETIEGMTCEGSLHSIQQALVDHDGLQCGFCTPGMVMALKAAVEGGVIGREKLARALSGNICRCGAYEHILDAAESVAQ